MRHFPSFDIGPFGRRQRYVRGHRIPVTITRHAANSGADCTIIVDTWGADDVMTLPGGCTCCTMREELQRTLRRLLAEREVKPFNRVIIETQQDLDPIVRTFVNERALGSDCYVEEAPALEGSRFVLTNEAPLSWEAFSRFAMTLTTLRGPDLLRAKGLVNVEGCRGPVAVEFMGHLAARPIELKSWPDQDQASRLDFITRGIEEHQIADLLRTMPAFECKRGRSNAGASSRR